MRTGKVMRDFKGSADDFAVGGTGGVAGVSWPVFRLLFLKICLLGHLNDFILSFISFG